MEEIVKIDNMGQWSIEKADVDTDKMSKPEMVAHINKLNQSGKQGEARRLYDKHISGGGAATKDVGSAPTFKKEEEEKSFQQKLKDIKQKYKMINESKESDPAKENTKLAEQQVKRDKMFKSNYGPKDMKLYSQKDNVKRKMKNTGEAFEDAGKNVNAKKYTTSGSSIQAAHEKAQQKAQNKKTKESTRTLADMSDEEKKALEEKYGAKIKKGELVKALADAGHIQSALLLKNWDEMDAIAEELLEKKSRCWEGYEPTPGKKAYEQGSCRATKKTDIEIAPEGSKNRESYKDEFEKKEDKPFHGYNKDKHSREGGMSAKAREQHNRKTGSNLQKPVTSKEASGSKKKANRRKSFCARMGGVKGPTSKDGKLTRKGAALKRWDCN